MKDSLVTVKQPGFQISKIFKLIVCIKKQSISFLIKSQLGNIFDFFLMYCNIQTTIPFLMLLVILNCIIHKVEFISVLL